MNKAFLHGNVGRDMEVKEGGEWSIGSFSLATTERRKKGDTWEEFTEWHTVKFWSPRDFHKKNIVKGASVLVEGKIHYWENDGKRGAEITATSVTVTKYADGNQRQPLQPKRLETPTQDNDLPF